MFGHVDSFVQDAASGIFIRQSDKRGRGGPLPRPEPCGTIGSGDAGAGNSGAGRSACRPREGAAPGCARTHARWADAGAPAISRKRRRRADGRGRPRRGQLGTPADGRRGPTGRRRADRGTAARRRGGHGPRHRRVPVDQRLQQRRADPQRIQPGRHRRPHQGLHRPAAQGPVRRGRRQRGSGGADQGADRPRAGDRRAQLGGSRPDPQYLSRDSDAGGRPAAGDGLERGDAPARGGRVGPPGGGGADAAQSSRSVRPRSRQPCPIR